MGGTKTERDAAYVWRWLAREGGHPDPALITGEVWSLLATRVLARRMARRCVTALTIAVAISVITVAVVTDRPPIVIVIGAIVVAANFAAMRHVVRADRRASATLARHVAKSVDRTVLASMGLAATATLAIAACVVVGSAGTAVWASLTQGSATLVMIAACGMVSAGVGIAAWRKVLCRPTIAVDSTSLVIDDLLRRSDLRAMMSMVGLTAWPLIMASTLPSGGIPTSARFPIMLSYFIGVGTLAIVDGVGVRRDQRRFA